MYNKNNLGKNDLPFFFLGNGNQKKCRIVSILPQYDQAHNEIYVFKVNFCILWIDIMKVI